MMVIADPEQPVDLGMVVRGAAVGAAAVSGANLLLARLSRKDLGKYPRADLS
jgi:hypothetical protein